MHASILAYMFSLVETNKVTVALSPTSLATANVQYVQEFLANLLKTAFPNLLK
jgi:exportin-1